MNITSLYKILFAVLVGGILGYSYYYFIGCESSCAIGSNPMITIAYGAFAGLIFGIPLKKKSKVKDENQE